MTPAPLERARLIAESRGIDLETAQELVYLRDQISSASVAAPPPDVEKQFLDASVAVWREIDRLSALPGGYKGLPPETDSRKRELAAWEAYRKVLDTGPASSPVAATVDAETKAEGQESALTRAELADIQKFQEQRRRSPVPQDAWLYVAEIDRLLAHIRIRTAPLCPVHQQLEDADHLQCEIGNDCVACSLHERSTLLGMLEHYAPADASLDSVTVLQRVLDRVASAQPSDSSIQAAAAEIADLSYSRHREEKIEQYVSILSKHLGSAAVGEQDLEWTTMRDALVKIFDYCGNDIQAIKAIAYKALPVVATPASTEDK